MKKINIIIASDHAGFRLKEDLIHRLQDQYNIIDCGTNSEESVDYPDYAYKLCEKLDNNIGILVCGSGIGISIAANRNLKARAFVAHDLERTKLARQHNNANIICFGARFINLDDALKHIDVFINTEFLGDRHLKRVNKLSIKEN